MGYCRESSCSKGIPRGGISGVRTVQRSAQAMMSALMQGPVSIGIDAGKFQTYRGGILSNCYGQSLDHGVLAVGYTSEAFKIKFLGPLMGRGWLHQVEHIGQSVWHAQRRYLPCCERC